jgi:hypothetical protein
VRGMLEARQRVALPRQFYGLFHDGEQRHKPSNARSQRYRRTASIHTEPAYQPNRYRSSAGGLLSGAGRDDDLASSQIGLEL